ncbi:tRNA pseudouridine(55) synthase TruB [Tissierella creatinini]|nr:tRNA pseudouridine(55) synthase TruB [Tissierella creatinini]TJX69149.1 tRNA pseudouridine(55) synthase TruB [Soehngenia saccharolytica]
MDGVINFFKPRGMTSHDAVYFFRRLLKIKKIGHTGTLDPNATGVLPICIGKATRISEYLLGVDKEYIGELTLGVSTDTQDSDGIVTNKSIKKVTDDEIKSVFSSFKGNILQVPPMYSALKIDGKKLYDLAREGKHVERKPREVSIKSLTIMDIHNSKEIIFKTKCSRGTYIRTLCDDIGISLGTYGYMSYLLRTGVGNFRIENAYGMETLQNMNNGQVLDILIPLDEAISHIERIDVPDGFYKRLVNGALIPMGDNYMCSLDNSFRIYCRQNFIGIGNILMREGCFYLKMDKVLL